MAGGVAGSGRRGWPPPLKFTDETLPTGWFRKLFKRRRRNEAFRWVVHINSPIGDKITSKNKLRKYIKKNGLQIDPDRFNFDPYDRSKEKEVETDEGSPPVYQFIGGVTPSSEVGQLVSEPVMIKLCESPSWTICHQDISNSLPG